MELAATVIRTAIERAKDRLEAANHNSDLDNVDLPVTVTIANDPAGGFQRDVCGSKLDPLTLATLEDVNRGDPVFQKFVAKLGKSLDRILNEQNQIFLLTTHEVQPLI